MKDRLEKANAALIENAKMQSVDWRIEDISDASWILSLSKLSGVVFPGDSANGYESDSNDLYRPPPRNKRDDGSTIFLPYDLPAGVYLLPKYLATDARALAKIIDPSLPVNDPNRFLTVQSPNVKYVLHCTIG